MYVVPARMHHIGHLRGKGQIRLLLYGQSVHIRTQQQELAGLAAVDRRYRTGRYRADLIGDAHLLQLSAHQCGCALLLKCQLRVLMDISAYLYRPVLALIDKADDSVKMGHMSSVS